MWILGKGHLVRVVLLSFEVKFDVESTQPRCSEIPAYLLGHSLFDPSEQELSRGDIFWESDFEVFCGVVH